jgi:hypothetical protein
MHDDAVPLARPFTYGALGCRIADIYAWVSEVLNPSGPSLLWADTTARSAVQSQRLRKALSCRVFGRLRENGPSPIGLAKTDLTCRREMRVR